MTPDAAMQPEPRARRRPSRRAVALVVVLDLVIASAVGFGTYFATRKFGAPTAPVDVQAEAVTCVPDECTAVLSSVTLTWSPPLYGGSVTRYLVFRDGAMREEFDPGINEFEDESVVPGVSYEYEVLAVGDEGRGPRSSAVVAEVPVPPITAARVDGAYMVVVRFVRIDLLSKYEGVKNPSVGDTTEQIWPMKPVCARRPCDVDLFGNSRLKQDGRTYVGPAPTSAHCGDKEVRSTKTVTFRVTKAKMLGSDLVATAFEGMTLTDFNCFGHKVHAVAEITGIRA